MAKKQLEAQIIGIDIGRGYVKAYTEVDGVNKEIVFKAVYSLGRPMEEYPSDIEKPIHIKYRGQSYFVGDLAIRESKGYTVNSSDEKTTATARTLLATAISKLAVRPEIKLAFGVPYRSYKKSTLNELREKYLNMDFQVEDLIMDTVTNATVVDVTMVRESVGALLWELKDAEPETLDKPIGIVTIGYKTTELSYFDKGMVFNDYASDTEPVGTSTMYENLRATLKERNIDKKVVEIDSPTDYIEEKEAIHEFTAENIEQLVSSKWDNIEQMDIYLGGGNGQLVAIKGYKLVQEPQMGTAKGCYLVGLNKWS